MNGTARILVFAAALAASPAAAQTVDDYVTGAWARSADLAAAGARVEGAAARLAALERPDPILVSAGTGDVRASFLETGTAYSLAPEASIGLARPLGTSVTASVGIDAASGSPVETAPSIAVVQPLDDLLGLAPARVDLLSARLELQNAERALETKRARLKTETLEALKAWTTAVQSKAQAEYALSDANAKLADAKALGSYRDGSAALLALETAVRSAQARLASAARIAELRVAAVELKTGFVGPSPPAPPAPAPFPDPASLKPEDLIAVSDAAAALEVERATARAVDDRDRLSLSVSGALRSVKTNAPTGNANEYSGALSGSRGDFSASVGGGWSDLADGYPFLTLSLSWKPERASDRRSEDAATAADLADAEAAWANARSDAVATIAGWIEQARSLETDSEIAEAERLAAEAAFAETVAARNAGFGSDRDVATAREKLDSNARTVSALAWSRLVFAETVNASLIAPGGSK